MQWQFVFWTVVVSILLESSHRCSLFLIALAHSSLLVQFFILAKLFIFLFARGTARGRMMESREKRQAGDLICAMQAIFTF